MENEIQEGSSITLDHLLSRLHTTVEMLEQAASRISVAASNEGVGPIVAMVEGSREVELMQRLTEAEKTIAELRAARTSQDGRKTLPVHLLAKEDGLLAKHDGTVADAGALDAALVSLSLEQRIAVKAHLLRAGLI